MKCVGKAFQGTAWAETPVQDQACLNHECQKNKRKGKGMRKETEEVGPDSWHREVQSRWILFCVQWK